MAAARKKQLETVKGVGSSHPPYEEKRCNDCHGTGGGVGSDLVKPKNELCFMCHPDILANPRAHGPAAVGDCLACHLPHDSPNSSLLIKPRSEICGRCHQEKRLAAAMHDRFVEKGMACPEAERSWSRRCAWWRSTSRTSRCSWN